jgi:hypothetical protein
MVFIPGSFGKGLYLFPVPEKIADGGIYLG